MITFLRDKTSERSQRITRNLQSFGLHNTFNPSVLEADGKTFTAFRGVRQPKDRPFLPLLMTETDTGVAPVLEDLSEAFAGLDLPAVSDPKLFRLGEEIWAAINTGHFEEPNRIYVMRLHPTRSAPIECRRENRQAIEKNWGFFLHGDDLCCLYMINPLTVLRCRDRHAATWEFEPHPEFPVGPKRTDLPGLTIGPQPVLTDTPEGPVLQLIAHQRFVLNLVIRRKRAYLGRAVEISLGDAPRVTTVGPLLGHSRMALLGSRIRHNKNLISCTYFSGLQLSGNRALLGYGLNDVTFAMADVPASDIGFTTFPKP